MNYMNENEKYLEKILWSIALPGLGQLLNGKLFKGLLFIVLEILINARSNLNEIIVLSFQGKIFQAVESTNYEWLMFYPCIYLYAIWDAYKDSGGSKSPYASLPFVFSAYMGTIGVIYSPVFKLGGKLLLGPLWLSILCFISGILIGIIIQHLLISHSKKRKFASIRKNE